MISSLISTALVIEGNSLSDLRQMDLINDTDNYIIIATYVIESYES